MNYTKWGFIIGTPITVIGLLVTIFPVQEIGCKFGWNSAVCEKLLQEVELVIQSETKEVLSDVKIQFIAKGIPETQTTDEHGFAKVKISSEGDVRVNISKEGYQTQDIYINAKVPQDTVRIIRLSQLKPLPTSPPQPLSLPNSSPADSPTTSSITPAATQTQLTKLDCVHSGRVSFDNGNVSISNQYFSSVIYMVYDKAVMTCEINNSSYDKQFSDLSLALGISDGNSCPIASFVTLYLDGRKVEEYELRPGTLKRTKINVTGARSFSINFQGPSCSSDGGVHFVDTTIY